MKKKTNESPSELPALNGIFKFTSGQTREKYVDGVIKDFEERCAERKSYELQWQLNMNFVIGNQYCNISGRGEVEDNEKLFFWQEREVFNHLAPILETRLAKLGRVRPKMGVLPATSDDDDVLSAKASSSILSAASHRVNLDKLISQATIWSETCGTAFYKIFWNSDSGNIVGRLDGVGELKNGDVEISAVPPFEIYPDSNVNQDIADCNSIIHAKAYPVEKVNDLWGTSLQGEEINVFNTDNSTGVGGGLGYGASVPKLSKTVKRNHIVVIERYERPTKEFPCGRLSIVAGRELLHIGELPFKNGVDNGYGFPFVKQVSIQQPGIFWGGCIIERAIPIQRAYNAVKNRKHEFLNRIAMGVLTVEDGSVDVDNLADEGLSPGKVLVYRQGSQPPVFMDTGHIPNDFSYEEEHLLQEFITVSGVSEIMRNSAVNKNLNSGIALQLLIEQDDTRLSVTADLIKAAVKEMAKQTLRLYKQYGSYERISRIVGTDGRIEQLSWNAGDITSDDVYFLSENEISETPVQKQNFMFELLKNGLLHDEEGKLSNRMRAKILDILGFGLWENSKDIETLQMKKAMEENLEIIDREISPHEIDDNELHIIEHKKFMLGGEYTALAKKNKDLEAKMLKHIREHKQFQKFLAEAEMPAEPAKAQV